jgi:ethanolamine utilization protein EutN
MQLARVIGSATSTVKHATLEGQKLLLVQPLAADGRSPDGDPLLVIDPVGAGRHHRVVISSDGKGARQWLRAEATPVRWMILGIVDPTHPTAGPEVAG